MSRIRVVDMPHFVGAFVEARGSVQPWFRLPVQASPIGMNVSDTEDVYGDVSAEIPSAAPLRVLLAEDIASVRNVARRVLEGVGFEVATVSNGAEALEMLRLAGGKFDVVLSDILMPEMDGIEFAVRARAEYPNLPVVFMTGFADISKDRERSRGICVAVLGKPFVITELVDTLRRAAGKK